MQLEAIVTMGRMNCSGCVRNITQIAQSLPSVEVITVDLQAKTVQLRYDMVQISLDAIKVTLAENNYPVVAEQLLEKDNK